MSINWKIPRTVLKTCFSICNLRICLSPIYADFTTAISNGEVSCKQMVKTLCKCTKWENKNKFRYTYMMQYYSTLKNE